MKNVLAIGWYGYGDAQLNGQTVYHAQWSISNFGV